MSCFQITLFLFVDIRKFLLKELKILAESFLYADVKMVVAFTTRWPIQ